jgi:hypothetical protein
MSPTQEIKVDVIWQSHKKGQISEPAKSESERDLTLRPLDQLRLILLNLLLKRSKRRTNLKILFLA